MTEPEKAEPLAAAPIPATDQKPHWLTEEANCGNCGARLARTLGSVGAHRKRQWFRTPGDWLHMKGWRAECDPDQVAYWQQRQAEATASGDATQ